MNPSFPGISPCKHCYQFHSSGGLACVSLSSAVVSDCLCLYKQVTDHKALVSRPSSGVSLWFRSLSKKKGHGRTPGRLSGCTYRLSTNHESLSQPIMKIGYWLHYFFHFSFCLTIVLGRIKFDCTLEDLHPVCQRKWFALEHSILSHLLWIARVAKSVLSRANLLPIL